MTQTTRTPVDDLRDRIRAERDKGNVVYQSLPGEFTQEPLDEFIKQPADGILYDLNRSEEVVMTFLADPKWVNDYAVALVIRKLHAALSAAKRDAYEQCARLCDEVRGTCTHSAGGTAAKSCAQAIRELGEGG